MDYCNVNELGAVNLLEIKIVRINGIPLQYLRKKGYSYRLYRTQAIQRAVAKPPANIITDSIIVANSGPFNTFSWKLDRAGLFKRSNCETSTMGRGTARLAKSII